MNVEGSDERPMDEGDETSVWESEFSKIFSRSAPYIMNRDDAQLSYHIGYIVWPLIVLEPIPKGPALWEYRC